MSLAHGQPVHPSVWDRWALRLRTRKDIIGVEVVLLMVLLALIVIVKAHPGPLVGDVGLTLWWQHLVLPHRTLTAFFDAISTINWPIPAALTIAACVAVFALARRWLDILIVLGLLVADAANWLINAFVQRPRPAGYGVAVTQHITNFYSFPSGHVEHALAILGMVVFLSFQVRRPAPWLSAVLWVVRVVLIAMIVLMSPSRVLEGEHWPSDGLAGLVWGGFWLLLGIQIYYWAAARWRELVPANERRDALPDAGQAVARA